MDSRQRRETERNIRSNDFLTENSADFAGIAAAVPMIADLTAKMAKVQEEFQKQLAGDGSVRQNYNVVKDAYGELLEEMRDITGFARSIGRKIAGLDDLFRVPQGSGKRKLIAAARVFADNAEQHKESFTDYGMSADFITELREKADALEASLDETESTIGERVGATDTLGKDVDEASDIVESIDPIVRRVYRDNPTKLAAWTYASHVERHKPKPRASPTP